MWINLDWDRESLPSQAAPNCSNNQEMFKDTGCDTTKHTALHGLNVCKLLPSACCTLKINKVYSGKLCHPNWKESSTHCGSWDQKASQVGKASSWSQNCSKPCCIFGLYQNILRFEFLSSQETLRCFVIESAGSTVGNCWTCSGQVVPTAHPSH